MSKVEYLPQYKPIARKKTESVINPITVTLAPRKCPRNGAPTKPINPTIINSILHSKELKTQFKITVIGEFVKKLKITTNFRDKERDQKSDGVRGINIERLFVVVSFEEFFEAVEEFSTFVGD